jgi:hypothetical protein
MRSGIAIAAHLTSAEQNTGGLPLGGYTMDFLRDLLDSIVEALRSAGVTFDQRWASEQPLAFLAMYIEFRDRTIAPTPRRVELSRELQNSNYWPTFQNEVTNLARTARAGEDLFPYQTKNIRTFDNQDLLLSDWNIHHLHLGPHAPGQQFATRTGPLLYATFLPDAAYFITIKDHHNFSHIELLEIIEANWPSYLDKFTVGHAAAISWMPDSADVNHLRKVGIQTSIVLRSGRVLFPPGGGYTSAKTSLNGIRQANQVAKILRELESFVSQQEDTIRTQLEIDGTTPIHLWELGAEDATLIGEGHKTLLSVPISVVKS